MTRHATREPAAIAQAPQASAPPGGPAARILEELDAVVRKSHRRSGLRLIFHSVGRAFAKLLSRMVPKTPPLQSELPPGLQSELPPEIWFPWF